MKTRAGVVLGVLSLAGALAVATGGCASAGLVAAGPLVSAIQAVTDRSVERTFPADIGTSWAATADALSRMAMRIQTVDRSGEAWTAEAKGDAVTLTATLEHVTPRLTRVSLRAEHGGLTADKKTAEEILNQVAISLAPPVMTGSRGEDGAVSAEQLSSLRQEIQKLGAKLEERDGRAAGPSPVSPATFDSSRILVVPASVGVPSVPTPPGAGLPARAETLEAERAPLPADGEAAASAAAARQSEPATPSGAALLRPAESLTPVGALTGAVSAK